MILMTEALSPASESASSTFLTIISFRTVWFSFGLILQKIGSPIMMGLLFYFTVTPTALIMRMLGKTPLGLTFDKDTESYWIERDPPGPEPKTMKNQF